MLLIMCAIAIFTGVLFLAMGLSFISQNLAGPDYYSEQPFGGDYFNNPLKRIKSKYFYWRPRNSVIVTRSNWEKIEAGINARVKESRRVGYKAALRDVAKQIEKKSPSINPYKLLDLDSSTPNEEIEARTNELLALYAEERFKDLDPDFQRLALIRRGQIAKARDRILNLSDISKGTF